MANNNTHPQKSHLPAEDWPDWDNELQEFEIAAHRFFSEESRKHSVFFDFLKPPAEKLEILIRNTRIVWCNLFDLDSRRILFLPSAQETQVSGALVSAWLSEDFKEEILGIGEFLGKYRGPQGFRNSLTKDALTILHHGDMGDLKKLWPMAAIDCSFFRDDPFKNILAGAEKWEPAEAAYNFRQAVVSAIKSIPRNKVEDLLGALGIPSAGEQIISDARRLWGFFFMLECAFAGSGWKCALYMPATPIESKMLPFGLHMGFREVPPLAFARRFKVFARAIFVPRLLSDVREHSARFAAAAIASRNMSHNLGSHVLSYLSDTDLFYNYLQERMNFVNELVWTKPHWAQTLRFVNDLFLPFIGFEITTDAKRSRKLRASQFKLLDNLFRSELSGKAAHPINSLRFIIEEDRPGAKPLRHEFIWKKGWLQPPDEKSLEIEDCRVDIPHGVVGRHALYAFLEGFIRNAAKHNRDVLAKNGLTIHIDIQRNRRPEEHWDDGIYFKLRIRDNVSRFQECPMLQPGECFECPENTRCRKHINHVTNEPLIDPGGRVYERAWGLKELRLCCEWLAGAERRGPALELVNLPDGGYAWEFFMLKPRNVLIVSAKYGHLADPAAGVYVKRDCAELGEVIKAGNLRDHMVVLDLSGSKDVEWLCEHEIRLPGRLFALCDGDSGAALDKRRFVRVTRAEFERLALKPGKLFESLSERFVDWFAGPEVETGKETLPQIVVNQPYSAGGGLRQICDKDLRREAFSRLIVLDHDDKHKPENPLLSKGVPYYYEPYSRDSSSSLARRLDSITAAGGRGPQLWSLYETCLSRIVVADDRLIRSAKNVITKYGRPWQLAELWRLAGIVCINIVGKGNDLFARLPDDRELPLAKFLADSAGGHFFIIHRALINDVINNNTKDRFDSEVRPAILKYFRSIIVHSNRGRVGIPSGLKFLDYSNLKQDLVDRFDKHLLTDKLLKLTATG